FITVSVGMVRVIRCHRRNMKNNIINGSEVSRLSVAIHNPKKEYNQSITLWATSELQIYGFMWV
ncbi:hypothetical protein ACLETV_17500, partial [Citrobacter braakii]|uniref:hypothetical protein n=1 Tax=Citrobacter braakii TaxID=57706 RepID=UPI003974AA05